MATDRERDAAVAEKVLGWKRLAIDGPYVKVQWHDGKRWLHTPDFTDPRADFSVLEHVREKWPREHIIDFALHLHEMWAQRRPIYGEGWVHYRPPDFADAALAVVREKTE